MSEKTLKAETLVSKWNALPNKDSDDIYERTRSIYSFVEPLQTLIEKEIEGTLSPEEKLVLEEYRRLFDFHTSYSINCGVDLVATYRHKISCNSFEDCQKQLKESDTLWIGEEEIDAYGVDYYVNDIGDISPSVVITQFELKEDKEKRLQKLKEDSIRTSTMMDSFKHYLWDLIDSHSLDDDFKATILLEAEGILNERIREECA